jgi:hypothetical protein
MIALLIIKEMHLILSCEQPVNTNVAMKPFKLITITRSRVHGMIGYCFGFKSHKWLITSLNVARSTSITHWLLRLMIMHPDKLLLLWFALSKMKLKCCIPFWWVKRHALFCTRRVPSLVQFGKSSLMIQHKCSLPCFGKCRLHCTTLPDDSNKPVAFLLSRNMAL